MAGYIVSVIAKGNGDNDIILPYNFGNAGGDVLFAQKVTVGDVATVADITSMFVGGSSRVVNGNTIGTVGDVEDWLILFHIRTPGTLQQA